MRFGVVGGNRIERSRSARNAKVVRNRFRLQPHRGNQLTDLLSNDQMIAMAREQLAARKEVRTPREIRIEPAKKLLMNSESGWKVYCIFDSEDAFLHRATIFEISRTGDIHLLERM